MVYWHFSGIIPKSHAKLTFFTQYASKSMLFDRASLSVNATEDNIATISGTKKASGMPYFRNTKYTAIIMHTKAARWFQCRVSPRKQVTV